MWDEMNAILVGDGTSNQETILLTHDGGDTWVNKGPGGSSIVVSTSVWAEGSNVAYVGQGGGVVLKTNDGGTSWFNLRGGLTSRNHIRAIWMTSATDGVIVGTESKILYTRSTGLVPE
jgi:photosystem II stability/assembly factor-like uncharacterized protein